MLRAMQRLASAWIVHIVLGAATALMVGASAPVVAAEAKSPPVRVVYHFDEPSSAAHGLRNIVNHLKADPSVQIVVVANGGGVGFLVADAKDSSGEPWEFKILELQQQGVKFEACNNTMLAMGLTPDKLVEGVSVVKAGVEEIARLQFRLGYAYIKP